MAEMFNGDMLSLAREVRRISQPELAEQVGNVAQGTLSKIERGQIQPEERLVDRLCEALSFRRSFFYNSTYRRMPPVSYHRKRKKLGARELAAIHGVAEVHRINLKKLLASVEYETTLPSAPAVDPDQHGNRVDEIADVLRQRWSIPRGPIADLVSLIEASGILIVSFDFGTPLIDGFAQHEGDGLPPIIFINSTQPKDRFRFSLAHELGHLVMHHTPNAEMEVQANLFASAFLMPRRDIENEFDLPSIQRFMELKLYWGTSMQALIYKAWEVGKISDRMFKYYNIELSKRGFRAKEPVDAIGFDESPKLFKEVVNAHLGELGYSVDELSNLCGMSEAEFARMYPVPINRPKLRVISN